MPTWSVTLNGDVDDLTALVDLGVGVTQEGDAFVFRSPELDALTEARAVRERAVEQVAVFSGLSRIAEGDAKARAVVVGAIFRDDGSRKDTFVTPDTLELRLRGRAAHLKGPGDPPASPYGKWTALSERAPAVRLVLRLFAGEPFPVNLYRVFEVIREDAGGEDQIVKDGWTTKKRISRFRHTMNSVAALGAEARHGVKQTTPPTEPMSASEAREFIRRLLVQWLSSK